MWCAWYFLISKHSVSVPLGEEACRAVNEEKLYRMKSGGVRRPQIYENYRVCVELKRTRDISARVTNVFVVYAWWIATCTGLDRVRP